MSFMMVERLHQCISIKEKLDLCKQKEMSVCSAANLEGFRKERTQLWKWADMTSEKKLDMIRGNIAASLLEKAEQAMPLSFLQLKSKTGKEETEFLQQSVANNCLLTQLNLGSDCRVARKDLAPILSKDVNNLVENDVRTLTYL